MTESLQSMANDVYRQLPDNWGFAILVTPFDDADGTVLYVSNANKNDMVEVIEKWVSEMKAGQFHFPKETDLRGGSA